MSNTQLPQVCIALSELLTPKKSEVSPDVDESIDKANQFLLENSFSEINLESKTHTPYYPTVALAPALGTDPRAFRQVLAEADHDEIRDQNNHTFISQGLALEVIDERFEQPRDMKQLTMLEATGQLIVDVASIPYQTVVAIGSQQEALQTKQQANQEDNT